LFGKNNYTGIGDKKVIIFRGVSNKKVDTLEILKFAGVRAKVTFHDRWKECIYIVNYRASAFFAQSPVLVVLVNDENKRAIGIGS
jgi:hypothetical protein